MLLGNFKRKKHIYIYYYISIYLYKYIHTYLPGDPGAVLITKSISLYYIHKYHHISTFVNTTKFKFFFNQTKFPLDSTAEMRSPMKSEEILVQIHQVDTFSRSDNGIHGKQASKSFEISRDTFANKKNPHMSQFLAWSWNTPGRYSVFFCLDWRWRLFAFLSSCARRCRISLSWSSKNK